MPMALMECYVQMLPRLESEEMLKDISVVGLGMGGGDEAKAIIRRLERQTQGIFLPVKKKEEDSMPEGRRFAAFMGMPIRVKKKPKKE